MKPKTFELGARYVDGKWVNGDGTPASILETSLTLERTSPKGFTLTTSNQHEGVPFHLHVDEAVQLAAHLTGQENLSWVVKTMRGDYITAAFATEAAARDYARWRNEGGRRWKAVKA